MSYRFRYRGQKTGKWYVDSRSYPFTTGCSADWSGWSTTYGSPNVGRLQAITDWVTPGYFKLRREGKWILNELRTTDDSLELFGFSDYTSIALTPLACTSPVDYYKTNYRGYVLSSILGSYPGVKTILTDYEAQGLLGQTKTECYANRNKGSTNLVESLAELDKSWRMMASPLENVRRFNSEFTAAASYKKLQKARRKIEKANRRIKPSLMSATRAGRAFLTLLSSEWLRYRYGISPLMSDIKAVLKTISETYDIKPKPHTARAQGSLFRQDIKFQNTASSFYRYNWTESYTHRFSVRANWTDVYQVTPFDKLGLTFHNVVGVAWELTHFSFVVDWFVNVGDLIYANIPRVGVDEKGGTVTFFDEKTAVYSANGIDELQPTQRHVTGTFADGVIVKSSIKQRKLLDMATDLAVMPDFKLDQWKRACDAIALIQQQLSHIRI